MHSTSENRKQEKSSVYLLDVGVVEVHPLADLGLEEEGGVVLAVIAHHAHQVELCLLGLLFRHPVEELGRGPRWWRGQGGGHNIYKALKLLTNSLHTLAQSFMLHFKLHLITTTTTTIMITYSPSHSIQFNFSFTGL